MTQHSDPMDRQGKSAQSLARLLFTLELEVPGPSQGDAIEHVEHLGVDPRSFQSITLVNETLRGGITAATFEVVGDAHQVERLQRVRDQLPASRRHLIDPFGK